jgi:hypothetical protein
MEAVALRKSEDIQREKPKYILTPKMRLSTSVTAIAIPTITTSPQLMSSSMAARQNESKRRS